jgi:hypothetical protein
MPATTALVAGVVGKGPPATLAAGFELSSGEVGCAAPETRTTTLSLMNMTFVTKG